MSRSSLRAASVAAVLAAAALGLAGCLDTGFPSAPTSSTPPGGSSSSPTPSRTPSDAPSPSATATAPPTPLSVACDALIPLQPLYDLNPNYGLVPASSADSGTLAAAALDDRGTACQVVHTSSGAAAVVTISQPSAAALAGDKAAAGSPTTNAVDPSNGESIPVYGSGSKLQAFTATHRFTAEGDASFSPEDLASVLAIAVHAQG